MCAMHIIQKIINSHFQAFVGLHQTVLSDSAVIPSGFILQDSPHQFLFLSMYNEYADGPSSCHFIANDRSRDGLSGIATFGVAVGVLGLLIVYLQAYV